MASYDLSLLFESTAELYTLAPVPAGPPMPAGWRICMPMGEQCVTVELFTFEPGKRGAYSLHVDRMPEDEWEQPALRVLEDLLAVIVTADLPMTDAVAETIACTFHTVWTSGTLMLDLIHLHTAYQTVADTVGMRWVTAKQVAKGRR